MGGKESSPSSSIDSSRSSNSSSSHPALYRRGLSTELRLGNGSVCHSRERDQASEAPIEQLVWGTLTKNEQQRLFVKVHMEGIPIGRKLDLHAHSGYDSLRDTLGRMFSTSIMCKASTFPDGKGPKIDQMPSDHVLTYQDTEGDWMMVGDVPWKVFLSSVKRLKIARADNC